MQIELIPVTSSNIDKIGHDGRNTLQVKFKTGALYQYDDVSAATFSEIMAAESVGKSFNTLVKANGNKFQRLN